MEIHRCGKAQVLSHLVKQREKIMEKCLKYAGRLRRTRMILTSPVYADSLPQLPILDEKNVIIFRLEQERHLHVRVYLLLSGRSGGVPLVPWVPFTQNTKAHQKMWCMFTQKIYYSERRMPFTPQDAPLSGNTLFPFSQLSEAGREVLFHECLCEAWSKMLCRECCC